MGGIGSGRKPSLVNQFYPALKPNPAVSNEIVLPNTGGTFHNINDPRSPKQTVWNDIQFNVESGRTSSVNFPDWDPALTTNTGAYKFDVDDYIDLGTNEMPHWWKEGTTIYPHIHIALDGAADQDYEACFTLYISYANNHEVYQEVEQNIEISIPNGTQDRQMIIKGGVGIDFSDIKIGAQVNLRLKRVTAKTLPEYPNHIFVTQIGIHVEQDTMGSREIFIK